MKNNNTIRLNTGGIRYVNKFIYGLNYTTKGGQGPENKICFQFVILKQFF